jgi:hypothetical protein
MDAVEQRLAVYSAKELRAIVRVFAQGTPVASRQAFLDLLQSAGATVVAAQTESLTVALLADIANLADEIEMATESAEDWDDYHEEDSLGPYVAFVEPLTDLFERTALLFDTGSVDLARSAYSQLFGIFAFEDEYGRGIRAVDLPDVDMRAARARYLRAVYDTAPAERRPAVLFAEMGTVQSWLASPLPRLEDLLQIAPQPLPDQTQFFIDWLAFLRTQSGSDADAWLREVVRLSQGTAGLAALARAEGQQHPHAYLDWCAALSVEDNMPAVLAAAHEALRALPEGLPLRAAVADYLCTAAAHLHDTPTLRTGRWEAFQAAPSLVRLLDVWEVTPAGSARLARMHEAAQHLQQTLARPRGQAPQRGHDPSTNPVIPSKTVLAHAYLLAGDWEAAHQLAAPEQVLGWSSGHNVQGLVVVCCLTQMSGALPGALPPNLAQLWQSALQSSTGGGLWDSADTSEASLLVRLQQVYAASLPATPWPNTQQQVTLLTWCLDVTQRRIEAIVGNQHRGSYDKAALLLAACAEVGKSQGMEPEADALIAAIRQRFPRHRAFQMEVQMALRRLGG